MAEDKENKPEPKSRKGNGSGQKKFIKTPEELWAHFENFVKQEQKSPWVKTEFVGKDGREVKNKLQVPILMSSFVEYCHKNKIHKDIKKYLYNVDGQYKDFIEVAERMKDFCFTQNFKGAAVGGFASGFIARHLGMVDKQEVQNTNIEVKMDLGKNKPKLTGE